MPLTLLSPPVPVVEDQRPPRASSRRGYPYYNARIPIHPDLGLAAPFLVAGVYATATVDWSVDLSTGDFTQFTVVE